MSAVTDELDAVVQDLVAAGVPASCNPGEVLTLAAREPAAALVHEPEELRAAMGFAALHFDVPVWLVTRPPNDLAATERLTDALVRALPAATPLDAVTRSTWDAGDGVELPALRWDSPRTITYPLTGARDAR